MDDKNQKQNLNETLQYLKQQKLQADKHLLIAEIIICVFSSIIFLSFVFLASFVQMQNWLKLLLIFSGVVLFIIGMCYALKLEQIAGYYECAKCHYRYVPSYKKVVGAMHINRTRYLLCPRCKEKSWSKKVFGKR